MAKQFPQSLQTHLDTGTTTLAWCWRLTRNDGAVFGFTDHDRPLTFDGTTFEPESGFTASEIRAGSDLSVDAQEAEGVLTSTTIASRVCGDEATATAAVRTSASFSLAPALLLPTPGHGPQSARHRPPPRTARSSRTSPCWPRSLLSDWAGWMFACVLTG